MPAQVHHRYTSKTVPRRPRLWLPDLLQRLAHTNATLLARVEWCRTQRTQARTQAELEAWRAEEEGLRDALLNGDRTYEYRHSTAAVFKRYVKGLKEGQVMICLAWMDCI